ncbi:hypothetical protein Fmac_030571 [Flemingia macrophylla]|uniref:Uncharacterized protein n=1 Tax=Flemingia macrophylla TaxID=520843 RepID=A0ABD1KZJ7_9FABA
MERARCMELEEELKTLMKGHGHGEQKNRLATHQLFNYLTETTSPGKKRRSIQISGRSSVETNYGAKRRNDSNSYKNQRRYGETHTGGGGS